MLVTSYLSLLTDLEDAAGSFFQQTLYDCNSMAIVLPFQSTSLPHSIEQAVICLQDGGILAVPTDSFYALAVGMRQPSALEKLQAIKGDRERKPFPVLIGEVSQLDQVVDEVPALAKALMQAFWPGLLTIVLKGSPHLSPSLLSERGEVGVRQPADIRVCSLLEKSGPVTGTSANRSGFVPLQSAQEVQQQLGAAIDLILDGGVTPGGQPSTVLQVEPELRILRQGSISRSALEKFWKLNFMNSEWRYV